MLLTIAIEIRLIPFLTSRAKQPIYEDGPKWHLSKSGTPTMGGVAFLIAISAAILFSGIALARAENKEDLLTLLLCQVYAILNATIGILDDLKKLKLNRNKGLSAKAKFSLQLILAIIFLIARSLLVTNPTTITFSFGSFDLNFLYYPIALIILLGIINCANLTDGIDGLATSVSFAIGVSLLYISSAFNTETSVLASAIIGASVGFLFFNLHPAKIFMGDTGSLYLGALISSGAFMLKNPLIIIFIAGVYVLEGCSVILQVMFFKITKRRLFKMAPIHHHLEQCGWSENRICIVAILLSLIFAIPAYIFYLP